MKVQTLVEKVIMKNGMEINVEKTEVTEERYSLQSSSEVRYLITVEGLFKEKHQKNFTRRHFTVPIYIDNNERGQWELDGYPGSMISFFSLSDSHHPEEREEFLHYCLTDKNVLKQIENKYGKYSPFCEWINGGCISVFGHERFN